jgi:hypothetical protein
MAQAKVKKAKASSKPRTSSSAKPKATRKPNAANGGSAKAVRDVVSSAGKEAGQAASKARGPLLAGGAALVGTVGGVVIGATHSGDKMLGVSLPKPKRVKIRSKDLTKAAKEVGRFGENVGELTAELKRAREGLAGGNGEQNSPIEILLKGLTARR